MNKIKRNTKENKSTDTVAYLVSFFLLIDAVKKYKRLRYIIYFSLFIILMFIIAIGLVISCKWIDNNNTKLFFLGGVGWLISYWFTKSKESSQLIFNIKKQYYCDFSSKILRPNISIIEFEVISNITCLFVPDDIKECIDKYQKEYTSQFPSQELLIQLRQEIFFKMRQDLYFTNFDLIDCFRYFLRIKNNKKGNIK